MPAGGERNKKRKRRQNRKKKKEEISEFKNDFIVKIVITRCDCQPKSSTLH